MKKIVNFRSLPNHIRDYHVYQLAISHDMIRIEEYLKSITDIDQLHSVSHKLEDLINYFNSIDHETENTENPEDCMADN